MTILDTIVAQKHLEVARLPVGPVAAYQLRDAIQRRGDGVRDFFGTLAKPRRGDVGLIAKTAEDLAVRLEKRTAYLVAAGKKIVGSKLVAVDDTEYKFGAELLFFQ